MEVNLLLISPLLSPPPLTFHPALDASLTSVRCQSLIYPVQQRRLITRYLDRTLRKKRSKTSRETKGEQKEIWGGGREVEEGTKKKPHVRKLASLFLISATLGRQVHDPKTFFSPALFSYDVPPVLTPAPTIAVVMRRPGTIRPSDARGACCVLLFVLSPPPSLWFLSCPTV